MLKISIGGEEQYDESRNEFFTVGAIELELEHSLLSLSKWESKYQKPFLDNNKKSEAEVLDYIRFMIVTPSVDDRVLDVFTAKHYAQINEYIESKETATTFSALHNGKRSREVITSELIYYWMVAYNIPFVCETWHLNRLFALIRICNVKNQPEKKMSKAEIARRNRELNEKRRAQFGTNG